MTEEDSGVRTLNVKDSVTAVVKFHSKATQTQFHFDI